MSNRQIPGPRSSETLKLFREFRKDTLGTYEKLFRQYGDIVQLSFLGQKVVMVFHPDEIQHVLKSNQKNYRKGDTVVHEATPIIGEGLITSNGETWLRQRKAFATEFHSKKIETYYPAICRNVQDTLKVFSDTRGDFDAYPALSYMAFNIIGECLLGVGVHEYSREVHDCLVPISELLNDRLMSVVNLPLWIPTPSNTKMNRLIARLNKTVERIMDVEFQRATRTDSNLLTTLTASDHAGCPYFSRKEIRSHVNTFLVAGHETTSNAIAWTLYLLASHPEIQLRVRKELNDKVAGPIPTLDELKTPEYTEAVLSESLRLYPPGAIMERNANEADYIKGYSIPKNTTIDLVSWVTHRHPQFWKDPDHFRPERFLDSSQTTQHPFAYFPFGAGARRCIGEGLAWLEAMTAIAAFIKNLEVERNQNTRVQPQSAVTLKPSPGLVIRVSPVSGGINR